MSIAELVHMVIDGGATSLAAVGLLPLVIGLAGWALNRGGQRRSSQLLANAGIAFGLMSLLLLTCTLIWANTHGLSVLEDVAIPWLLAPVYLVVASFVVEHWLHPGPQEGIRERIRGALLIVIVLAVIYWLLSRMQVWMLVHTNIMGLLMFLAAMVGILYFLVRKSI